MKLKTKLEYYAQNLIDWWFKIRGKYNFEITCAFRDQLNYEIFRHGKDPQEYAFVPMHSGRTGYYKVDRNTKNISGNTGQYNWQFTFIRIFSYQIK